MTTIDYYDTVPAQVRATARVYLLEHFKTPQGFGFLECDEAARRIEQDMAAIYPGVRFKVQVERISNGLCVKTTAWETNATNGITLGEVVFVQSTTEVERAGGYKEV